MSNPNKEGIRVHIFGMPYAGNTSIIMYLQGKHRENLKVLKPTLSLYKLDMEISNVRYEIWDFACQTKYRELYLREPENYLTSVDFIVYIIDIQDSNSLDIAFKFLKDIDTKLNELGEKPKLTILFHKADPEYRTKSDYLNQIKTLRERVKRLDLYLEYQINVTSLYHPAEDIFDLIEYDKNSVKDKINFIDLLDVLTVEKFYEKKKIKIVILGMDFAGNSSIARYIVGEHRDSLKDLVPNKGVDKFFIDFLDIEHIIWDFAGQETYRENYLNLPEQFFISAKYIIYLIDIQDTLRYDKSLKFLKQIDKIFVKFKQISPLFIFFHKADPEIRNKPEFRHSINTLKEKINNLEIQLPYQIYLTSLYQPQSPVFNAEKYIKEIQKDNPNFSDILDIFVYKKLES